MKAEDKIIELLSEYLQKTDRLLDRMEKTDRNINIISKTILDHSVKFSQVSGDIKKLNEDIKGLSEDIKGLSEDIKGLSEKGNQMREDQGIMLKELLSISKRVSTLED